MAEFCRTNQISCADATRRIPLPSGSAEVVYSSHMLEHLDQTGARRFLREAQRVLAPGGIFRVAVPDLRRLVCSYISKGDADELLARSHLSGSCPRGLLGRVRLAVVGPRNHQWMYDGLSLSRLLTSVGFLDPVILGAGESTIASPEPLDLFERADESVYVEARRA